MAEVIEILSSLLLYWCLDASRRCCKSVGNGQNLVWNSNTGWSTMKKKINQKAGTSQILAIKSKHFLLVVVLKLFSFLSRYMKATGYPALQYLQMDTAAESVHHPEASFSVHTTTKNSFSNNIVTLLYTYKKVYCTLKINALEKIFKYHTYKYQNCACSDSPYDRLWK